MRRQQEHAHQRPEQRFQCRRRKGRPAREHVARQQPHRQRDGKRDVEHRNDLHRLLHDAKPQHAALDADGRKAQQGVSERMLAKECPLVHVHHETEQERHADTHAARLVHVPEHQRHCQQVGHGGLATQRQHVERQGDQQREGDEEGVDRQQQLVGATRHDHGATLWFSAVMASALPALPALRARSAMSALKPAPKPRAAAYRFTPAASGMESVINVAGDIGNAIDPDEETKRATRNAIETVGYFTGLTTGQMAVAAQFVVDVSYDEKDPQDLEDWYDGLSTGKLDAERDSSK